MQRIPFLSIISVTFQDIQGIRRTLDSLRHLIANAGQEIEVLVMDGGTGPEIEALSRDFPWAAVHSSPDLGIYDAMNKGIDQSRGRFVWFLNGGDENLCESWEELQNALQLHNTDLVMFGYVLDLEGRQVRRASRSSAYIWHALPTSHQAIFYAGDTARSARYDLTFNMSADYQYTAQLLHSGSTAATDSLTVARFYADGFSSKQSFLIAQQAQRVQREILHSNPGRILASRVRHLASRSFRRFQTRTLKR